MREALPSADREKGQEEWCVLELKREMSCTADKERKGEGARTRGIYGISVCTYGIWV